MMIFSDPAFDLFSVIHSKVRSSLDKLKINIPYKYEGESFFEAYQSLRRIWKKRESQRYVASTINWSRDTLREWETNFVQQGAVGLLSLPTFIDVDPMLERLVVLVNEARPHTNSGHILTLAQALGLTDASIDIILRIQRSYGYGQRQDKTDKEYYSGLQNILNSIQYHKSSSKRIIHDPSNRCATFINYEKDYLQHKVELFCEINACSKRRQISSILQRYGIQSSRFYLLRERYLQYGVWGLVDLTHTSSKKGEKISADLELKIIEERLLDPSLSTRKIIKTLRLKCSQTNIQKIFSRWKLSKIKEARPIRGVVSSPIPDKLPTEISEKRISAKSRFPNLLNTSNLKVNGAFSRFMKQLEYHHVPLSNPGTIITAPFLDQLGVVESIHTYGPETFRTTEISNDIIFNVFRIIAGFPTINSYMLNTDNSVAIGAGRLTSPCRSKFYLGLDDFSFDHLQKLRNDLALRAFELNVIDGKEIAIDYHCDPTTSNYPRDKGQSKSPDKNKDVVYAHRPQLLWDSGMNTIINIAYCEGRSRAPSALYKFMENNLFQIIDPAVVEEIYADSEYTGEKQLVYLIVRSASEVTMCLRQNPKIKRWKEETLTSAQWQPYGKEYRIASHDFGLPETNKGLRFVVKQHIETLETRCFGSTHMDRSASKILDSYHIRWSVESGIKDLIENYFLNKPTGDSPEKVEVHYYCVMIARLLIDYFCSVFKEPHWKKAEGWESVLSTIRTTIFSNQNCELSLNPSGDLLLTYLDGDPLGIKAHLKDMLERRSKAGLNKVSWWGGRGVQIAIEDRYRLKSGLQNK